jgi:hypothetical protein
MKFPFSFDNSSGEFPVVHRLAVIYLMLPLVIWLVGWFRWWLGVPAVVVLVLALWRPLAGSWRFSLRPVTLILLLLALVWVMMTAAGGVLDLGNFDWDKHRALFLDLSRGDWPLYFTAYFEAPLLLRYYLGYYMVPGLVAGWLGASTLNWAVPLWTWGGTGLILLLFARGLSGWRAPVAALLFMFFATIAIGIDPLELRWGRTVLVEFMFSPQHFLSAALSALLLIQLRGHPRFQSISGLILAATMFWSPLVALGMLLLLGILAVENRVRPFLTWQNLLVSVPLLALLFTYLSSGAGAIPGGWLWERHGWDGIATAIGLPRVLGYLTLAVPVFLLRPDLRRDPLFLSCLLLPLFIPWYAFGLLNEYLRYASMITFVLLCYYAVHTVLMDWESVQRWIPRTILAAMALLLVVSFARPVTKLSLAGPVEGLFALRYENLDAEHSTVLSANAAQYHDQYATFEAPFWFRRLLRNPGPEPLAKGELIIEAEYDVFLDGRSLVYVRDPCEADEVESRFILFVYPENTARLEGRDHDNQDFFFSWNGRRIGGICIATHRLPEYEIDYFKTGQYRGNKFAPSGERWVATYHVK